MNEAQAAVMESPTTVEMQVERGPLVNLTGDQRTEFRKTGELPKPEEAAASTEVKTPEVQEKPAKKAKTAEERIAELESTIDKIRKGAGKETPKVESSPTKPETQFTRPKPTTEDKKADGTPKFATYEDYVEELADWKAEQRWATQQREQAAENHAKQFKAKMEEASGRHENFEAARDGFIEAMSAIKISPAVQDMLNDSDVFPDLVAVIGGSKEEASKFAKMAQDNPGKALRYIALTESLIADELAGKTEEAPAKPKTQAPKPPSTVGGQAASPPDGMESAAKAGDFRSFKAEANRRYLAKLKS